MAHSFRPPVLKWACGVLSIATIGTVGAQETWRRTYGGNGADRAACVRQTDDGGYIVAGSTGSFGHGSGDVYLVRLSADGDLLWSRTYGGPGVETGVACRPWGDGFVIAGTTFTGSNGSYDLLVIRTDAQGEMLWQRNYGTAAWDLCNAMDAKPDGLVIGGITYGDGSWNGAGFVVRTDLEGEVLWTARSGAVARSEVQGLVFTADGGVAVAGVEGEGAAADAWAWKLSADGQEEWSGSFGGDEEDAFSSIVQTADGGYAALGSTKSVQAFQQILLMGLDPSGGVMWQREIGNAADAGGAELRTLPSGGFVLTGYNTLDQGERDMILTVTDHEGWFQFGNNFGDGRPADGLSVDPTADGGFVVAGWSEGYGPGPKAMYVVKTDDMGQTASVTVVTTFDPLSVTTPTIALANVFPNPARSSDIVRIDPPPTGRVQLQLIDPHGRSVGQDIQMDAQGHVQLPAVAAGMYVLEMRADGARRMARFVVER